MNVITITIIAYSEKEMTNSMKTAEHLVISSQAKNKNGKSFITAECRGLH